MAPLRLVQQWNKKQSTNHSVRHEIQFMRQSTPIALPFTCRLACVNGFQISQGLESIHPAFRSSVDV